MSFRYRMDLAYDGRRYKGWQRLGASEKGETLQGRIEATLSRLLDEPIEIEGAGRTDAGVHALGQVATFSSSRKLNPEQIMTALNGYLPEDLSVRSLSLVPQGFHARYSAVSKTYLYRITNTAIPDPFSRLYSLQLEAPLDLTAMREAAACFEGEHDFTGFTTAKSKKKSMVRRIHSLQITSELLPELDGHRVEIRITANGFLHNMARKITGTLIETGLGRVPSDRAAQILRNGDRSLSSELAPAHGLYLEHVSYRP